MKAPFKSLAPQSPRKERPSLGFREGIKPLSQVSQASTKAKIRAVGGHRRKR